MEYRNLGRSGLKVSQLSLGTNAFGTRSDDATSIAVVHTALDAGINLIDTADVYGYGESERIIGLALKDRRTRAVLATKCGRIMAGGPNESGCARQHILNSVDASLRRLQIDYIDLYQMHQFDDETPLDETLGALNDLVRWGKVRYIGCSNYASWQMIKALGISHHQGYARFISNQPDFSPINRHIEREIIPAGLSEGVGQIVYFPLAAGLFTGKYRLSAPVPEGSRAAFAGDHFVKRWLNEENLVLAATLEKLATENGITLPNLVLAWVMAKPGITSAIVGASRPAQVIQNVAACDVQLSEETVRQIDELTQAHC